MCMSSVGIMNISLTILLDLSPEGSEKNFIDFSYNTLPMDTDITNSFHYGEFD